MPESLAAATGATDDDNTESAAAAANEDTESTDAGAADADTTTDTENTGASDEADAAAAAALGDAGKKALDAMKAERNAARQSAAAAKRERDELQRLLDAKDKPAEEVALDEARRTAKAEAAADYQARLLRSAVVSTATGKLANPQLALRLIDLDGFVADDSGEFDPEDIEAAIAALLTDNPGLAAVPPKRFQGTADQGAKAAAKPAQLTREDLAKMPAAERLKAAGDGRLDHLLGK